MKQDTLASNPFMLMLNPQVVLDAMERSAVLDGLHRRTCHPLDRPGPAGGVHADGHRGRKPAHDDVDIDIGPDTD